MDTDLIGSPIELKWNHKDLESLRHVVSIMTSRRTVVQAGGCLGVFARYLSSRFEAVYTFEPDPNLFYKLCQNVRARNVVKLQAALGHERKTIRTVCELRPNDGKSVLHEGMTRTEPDGIVPTLRVDDLGLASCDLIYLDVEGDELYALHGARETIGRHRPLVVCEVNRGIEYRGLRQDDVEGYLRLLGYSFYGQLRSDKVFLPNDRPDVIKESA